MLFGLVYLWNWYTNSNLGHIDSTLLETRRLSASLKHAGYLMHCLHDTNIYTVDQSLKQFNRDIRVRLATSIWYDTLMKNCFKNWSQSTVYPVVRVPTVREKSVKMEIIQGQGKVREFWVESGKFEILEKEFYNNNLSKFWMLKITVLR